MLSAAALESVHRAPANRGYSSLAACCPLRESYFSRVVVAQQHCRRCKAGTNVATGQLQGPGTDPAVAVARSEEKKKRHVP
jgi:hypothetical protein